jgi:uncharacterized protein
MSEAMESRAAVPKLGAGQRIDSLDLLRGIAILGIFMMNTWTMSLPQNAYTNAARYDPNWVIGYGFPSFVDFDGNTFYSELEPLTGLNRAVYIFVHLVADMKFISTFSILFGAGIVLQSQRAEKTGRNPWRVHYLRMAILLLFGLIHTFGFWYGDILTDYALLGMLLAPLRKLPAALLLVLGLALVCAQPVSDRLHLAHLQLEQKQAGIPPEERKAEPFWQKVWDPIDRLDVNIYNTSGQQWADHLRDEGLDPAQFPASNDRELQVYRSGWWDQIVGHRFWASVQAHTAEFLTWTLFRCGGLFLVGMGLHKLRFFNGTWPRWLYAVIPLVLAPIGWFITYRGVLYNESIHWNEDWYGTESLWHKGVYYNYYGSLLCALGYISAGVVLALITARPALRVLHVCLVPIRAVGRMALTCYLTETLIGTTLFYGHGFGKFGMFTRAELLFEVVLPAWAGILMFATLWLTLFRQGPLEWLWHSIVYWDWRNPRKAAAGPDKALTPTVPGMAGQA